jgi:hypothetical protein
MLTADWRWHCDRTRRPVEIDDHEACFVHVNSMEMNQRWPNSLSSGWGGGQGETVTPIMGRSLSPGERDKANLRLRFSALLGGI